MELEKIYIKGHEMIDSRVAKSIQPDTIEYANFIDFSLNPEIMHEYSATIIRPIASGFYR